MEIGISRFINMRAAFLLPFFLFFEALSGLRAQSIIFNKVLPPEGTNFLHITAIVQGKEGFMWFASKKGLYRYDGYNFVSYKNNPLNPNSLSSNSLECMAIDSSGILWIGCFGGGLDRFDPVTETFTHFLFDPKNKTGLSGPPSALLYDSKGILWVGTSGGLDRLDPKTGQFIHYGYQPGNTNSLSNNEVRTLYEDHQGTLWVGTGSPYLGDSNDPEGGGLNKMIAHGKFIRYLHDPDNPHSLINNKVGAIYEDSKGNFWVGTAGDGLHTMDRRTGSFERHQYDSAHPEKLSRSPLHKGFIYDHITFIKEDASGAIWIGTSDAGINRYDPGTKKVKRFLSYTTINIDLRGTFDDITSWAAFSSADGIFWIGTIAGNLFHFDPFSRNLPFVALGSPVFSFVEGLSGKIWIATTRGFISTDSTGKEKTRLKYLENLNGHNGYLTVQPDTRGNLWAGSNYGLYLIDTIKGTVTHYQHDEKNKKTISDDFITYLYEDNKENLWIGTFRGLDKMDRQTGEFTHYKMAPNDTSRFSNNMVSAILKDKQEKFWVGSYAAGGIHQFNLENGTFKDYLVGTGIRCIYQDADGILWVGADDGLYKYNNSSDIFIRFTDPSSPSGINSVNCIIEDNEKKLWMGTTDGIIRLNRQRNETTLYGKNYNINANELTSGIFKDGTGNIYFGTNSGYIVFDPSQVKSKSKPPRIIFSVFRLADKEVKPGNNNFLTAPLNQLSSISLPYNENIFSIDFIAIDYTNPSENRYLFMLENYDNTWHQAGADRRASFYNVPPGKYNFKVKASNSDGVWNEKSITIIITPPWWRTLWAYCLYALLIIAAVIIITRIQKRRIISRERERTKEKELAQAREIEKAYNELKTTQAQLIQSEKMASLGELTAGIAHEIQNPLNFINNFSEVNSELIDEMRQEIKKQNFTEVDKISLDIKENEEKINHHGKRADSIVKGMLQHSRTSSGQKEPTDINSLTDEYLRLTYHGLRAKDKTFNATIRTDFDKSLSANAAGNGLVNVIPQDIGRVLLNLFTNAFYSVKEKKAAFVQQGFNEGGIPISTSADNYEPTVSVTTLKQKDKVIIKVKDNGVGIPQNIMDKIFLPFFTTKPTGKGTGLGLSMSYDIIKAHGGELKVATEGSEGAEFIIELPLI
jgi:Signal transduction histidine kinase regulating C4-dicarboxylate transport system